MLVLVGGLLLRLAVTLVSLCGAGLSTGEKLLISLAWLPKTTAQATLGSVLLDVSHKYEAEPFYEMGEQILSLSVLSTLSPSPSWGHTSFPKILKTCTQIRPQRQTVKKPPSHT